MYRVFRNSLGQVDAINHIASGATIPLWDEADPLTIAYHEWRALHPGFDDQDSVPEVPPTPTPEIGMLRMGCLADPGYNRIIGQAFLVAPNLVSNFQIAVSVAPCSLYGLQVTWNAMIAALPSEDKPSSAELAALQAIANGAHFNTHLATITFNPDGTITCSGQTLYV